MFFATTIVPATPARSFAVEDKGIISANIASSLRRFASVSDITAPHQANHERESLIWQLEKALAEKTICLKEVHHRVKNNLAVIAVYWPIPSATSALAQLSARARRGSCRWP